jgi:uncharacterized membrane protein YtjA (UPF0391 family)
MIGLVVLFLIIALVAAFFGFGAIVQAATSIALVLFWIFLVLFLVTLILSLVNRSHRHSHR